MVRPISTEHPTGVSVCPLLARSVIREAFGSMRYCSFSGLCIDLRSIKFLLLFTKCLVGYGALGSTKPERQLQPRFRTTSYFRRSPTGGYHLVSSLLFLLACAHVGGILCRNL